MNTTTSTLLTITKTFTPEIWWNFQKQAAVVDVLEMETVLKIEGYKEVKITFTWDTSKAD